MALALWSEGGPGRGALCGLRWGSLVIKPGMWSSNFTPGPGPGLRLSLTALSFNGWVPTAAFEHSLCLLELVSDGLLAITQAKTVSELCGRPHSEPCS